MPSFELIENACNDHFNLFVIQTLKEQRGWRLSPDHYDTKIAGDMAKTKYAADIKHHSDTGMLLLTYSDGPLGDDINNQYLGLNTLAQYIFDSIMEKSKTEYIGIAPVRILWNYYNRASTGVFHVDKDFDKNKYFSIVYHLNTCDGGTVIKQTKIPSVSGNAIIFESNVPHCGLGPNHDPARYVLNILLRYESKKVRK